MATTFKLNNLCAQVCVTQCKRTSAALEFGSIKVYLIFCVSKSGLSICFRENVP